MFKILVVEDDQILSELYVRIFTEKGYTVEAAVDCEDGVNKIISTLPDLFLLDIMLHKKTGFEVLEELRNTEKTKNIKVVMMTNILPDKQDLYLKEADSVFIKSEITPGQLLDKVWSLLN